MGRTETIVDYVQTPFLPVKNLATVLHLSVEIFVHEGSPLKKGPNKVVTLNKLGLLIMIIN